MEENKNSDKTGTNKTIKEKKKTQVEIKKEINKTITSKEFINQENSNNLFQNKNTKLI